MTRHQSPSAGAAKIRDTAGASPRRLLPRPVAPRRPQACSLKPRAERGPGGLSRHKFLLLAPRKELKKFHPLSSRRFNLKSSTAARGRCCWRLPIVRLDAACESAPVVERARDSALPRSSSVRYSFISCRGAASRVVRTTESRRVAVPSLRTGTAPGVVRGLRTRTVQRGGYEATINITSAGHVVAWRYQGITLTEVAASAQHPLPQKRRLLSYLLKGRATTIGSNAAAACGTR